jgi:hypothetical protein
VEQSALVLLLGLAAFFLSCNTLGRWLQGEPVVPYLHGKLAAVWEWRAIRAGRRRVHALTREAGSPIRFPVDTDLRLLFRHIGHHLKALALHGYHRLLLGSLHRSIRLAAKVKRAVFPTATGRARPGPAVRPAVATAEQPRRVAA